MVERFEPKLIGAITFLPDADGEWVKASDYDALAAELAREREAYKTLLESHEALVDKAIEEDESNE